MSIGKFPEKKIKNKGIEIDNISETAARGVAPILCTKIEHTRGKICKYTPPGVSIKSTK
jgi:hypothetical protein